MNTLGVLIAKFFQNYLIMNEAVVPIPLTVTVSAFSAFSAFSCCSTFATR
jgi:hypothetical protein